MGQTLDIIQRVHDSLYERITTRFNAEGMPTALPKDSPKKLERHYITLGDIDLGVNCPQFAVAARRIYKGLPGAEEVGGVAPHGGAIVRSLEIGISYSRPFPVSQNAVLPHEKETVAGSAVLAECDIVIEETLNAYVAGELVDSCNDAALGPWTFLGPEGGVAGVTVLLAVQL